MTLAVWFIHFMLVVVSQPDIDMYDLLVRLQINSTCSLQSHPMFDQPNGNCDVGRIPRVEEDKFVAATAAYKPLKFDINDKFVGMVPWESISETLWEFGWSWVIVDLDQEILYYLHKKVPV